MDFNFPVVEFDFVIGHHHKTAFKQFDFHSAKRSEYPLVKGEAAGLLETQEHDSAMGSRLELPNIGEVKILGDEKAAFLLTSPPNVRIACSNKVFGNDRIRVVTHAAQRDRKRIREVFIQFHLHPVGTGSDGGSGISSTAAAAA